MTLLLWEYKHPHAVLTKRAAVLRQTNTEFRRAFLVQNIQVCNQETCVCQQPRDSCQTEMVSCKIDASVCLK